MYSPPNPSNFWNPASALEALARASQEIAVEDNPAEALWTLICILRQELPVDRAGVFAYDANTNVLDRIVGVSDLGEAEFAGDTIPVVPDRRTPLISVALRTLPYYFTQDVREDFPEGRWPPKMYALAVVPIIAGNELLGALCADNRVTGQPFPPNLLDPLFLFAALAARPLFALFRQKERDREENMRRVLLRQMLSAVSDGRICLCDVDEIRREWPDEGRLLPIQSEQDIRPVRVAAQAAAEVAGIPATRAADLALCTSEAATNALVHGRGGEATVAVSGGRVRVGVSDRGHGILLEDLPAATLRAGWTKSPAQRPRSAGLGFTVITRLADRVLLHTGTSGTTLLLEMCARPPREQFTHPLLWDEDTAWEILPPL
jgi:anti-sigma regulatory factor (Ser/Thr protein kinase)